MKTQCYCLVIREELVDQKKAKSALMFQLDYFANDSCYEEDVELSIPIVTDFEVQCENAENIQSTLVPLSISKPIRKRGRPKDSKNKPKT